MVKPFVLQNGFEKAIMKGKEGGRMYRTANDYYKEKYGTKVYKLSLDGGFTCPNRDGRVSTGGCIFCSSLGGGEFAECGTDITAQLEKAKKRVAAKIKDGKTVTGGGRVLGVTETAPTLKEAIDKAYETVKTVSFENAYYRKDIGKRALEGIR